MMRRYYFCILFTVLSVAINGCRPVSDTSKKYEWIPTECAPENYPVEIYSGTFFYGKQDSIYIPSGKTVDWGWGNNGSSDISGELLKQAPYLLKLSWISFADKKEYTGVFKLDTKKIGSLLHKGFITGNPSAKQGIYDRIKVGMAPGGVVILWLSGSGSQIEAGRYQARETKKLDWARLYIRMDGTIFDYADKVIHKLPKPIQRQIVAHQIPYGLWDKWREKFVWKPSFRGFPVIQSISVYYFNKELDNSYTKEIPFNSKAAVEKLNVFWQDKTGRKLRTEIRFDEHETYQLFHQAGTAAAVLQTDFKPEQGRLRVKLQLEDQELLFKQIKAKTYLL